jgi:transposase
MVRSISDAKKAHVEAKLALGLTPQTIAAEEHMAIRTVQHFATMRKRYGTIQKPKAPQQGRPRIITPEMEQGRPLICLYSYRENTKIQALLQYLAARPSLHIDEQAYFLWDEFHVWVSDQAIKRMLKRVKWSKKKVCRHACSTMISTCFLTL